MKVTLVNFTPHALATLVFTKSTRLKMSGTSLAEVLSWPLAKLMDEWKYMQNTIKSSWEFVDYIFAIEGVSRAFTHQLVRHRIGTSFAQQSQRSVEMDDFEYIVPSGLPNKFTDEDGFDNGAFLYASAMEDINHAYKSLVEIGVPPQDARGVLPTNISTNIIFKANLRTLNGMCAERLCVKAQGEFQDVMRAIRDAVIAEHPWAEPALRVHCAQHGTCAFPTFSGCPIKGGVFNPETGFPYEQMDIYDRPMTKDEIHAKWLVERAEAQPAIPKESK